MAIFKFRKGDKVKIDPLGVFSEQCMETGMSCGVIMRRGGVDGWHHVRFDNGYNNDYRDQDLLPWKKPSVAKMRALYKELDAGIKLLSKKHKCVKSVKRVGSRITVTTTPLSKEEYGSIGSVKLIFRDFWLMRVEAAPNVDIAHVETPDDFCTGEARTALKYYAGKLNFYEVVNTVIRWLEAK